VEGEEEAERAHREAQHGRTLALAEQVRDVQHRPVAAECENQVCVVREEFNVPCG
jgi:hypothetical protein